MNHLKLAALLCALATQVDVHAATYLADLAGAGIHQDEFGNEPVTWTGLVTVTTDGSQDGTYTGDTLESISVASDWVNYSYTKGQTPILWEALPGLFLPVGPEAGASVTLSDGLLTGITLAYDDYAAFYDISGLGTTAQTLCRTDNCHGIPDNILLAGTLTPVPEPAVPALMLVGLALLGTGARRRGT